MDRTPSTPIRLTDAALTFLGEYHLGTLTTLRKNGTPHVVAVGFTWDQEHGLARVITNWLLAEALNLPNAEDTARRARLDGPRWMTLEGSRRVLTILVRRRRRRP